MEVEQVKRIVEAALLAAGQPLGLADLERLFAGDHDAPPRDTIRRALADLDAECACRGVELHEVASGYRLQVPAELGAWVGRLWEERPPRYSRALLETLAIIAYRQPVTRPEIEEIRGVSVSSQTMRTLQERQWVRVIGHRDTPGRPAMFGTTREFLDHFNLKALDQLPPLSEIRDLGAPAVEFPFEAEPATAGSGAGSQATATVPPPGADGEACSADGPESADRAHTTSGEA